MKARLDDAAYLDMADQSFYTYSEPVRQAQAQNWYGRGMLADFIVLRYGEVSALLRDPRWRQGTYRWLEVNGITDGPLADFWEHLMLNMIGEEHTRIRRLVGKAFTPPAVDALRPFMRATAERLVEQFAAQGECEFISAFADPLPLEVICELLGIPHERRASFNGWGGEMSDIFGLDLVRRRGRLEAAVNGLLACVDEVIAQRRTAPASDLVSALIAVEENGDRLTSEELRMLLVSLVFLGNDTTRLQLSLTIHAFAQEPEQWALLAEHPELAATATEEAIRCFPVVPTVSRIAREDGEFQGLRYRKGANIMLMLAAANRDPAVFGQQNDFDIRVKDRPRNLSFGGGIYHCLGNWLARAEIAEALPMLASRLRNLHLAGTPQWRKRGLAGPITLPIGFTPS